MIVLLLAGLFAPGGDFAAWATCHTLWCYCSATQGAIKARARRCGLGITEKAETAAQCGSNPHPAITPPSTLKRIPRYQNSFLLVNSAIEQITRAISIPN